MELKGRTLANAYFPLIHQFPFVSYLILRSKSRWCHEFSTTVLNLFLLKSFFLSRPPVFRSFQSRHPRSLYQHRNSPWNAKSLSLPLPRIDVFPCIYISFFIHMSFVQHLIPIWSDMFLHTPHTGFKTIYRHSLVPKGTPRHTPSTEKKCVHIFPSSPSCFS